MKTITLAIVLCLGAHSAQAVIIQAQNKAGAVFINTDKIISIQNVSLSASSKDDIYHDKKGFLVATGEYKFASGSISLVFLEGHNSPIVVHALNLNQLNLTPTE